MAGAVVQVWENSNGAAGTTLASGSATVTTGNKLYVVANAGDNQTMTPTKNSGTATISAFTDHGSVQEAGVLDKLQHWTADITGSGTLDVLITYGGSTDRRGVIAVEVSGVDAVDVQDETTDTGSNPTADSSVTVTAQPAFGLSFGTFYQGGTPTAGTGWSASGGTRWSGVSNALLQVRTVSATGTLTANFVNGSLDRNNAVMLVFTDTPTPVAQAKHRFRNDDGSETTATWAASQDANITHPLSSNLRLRFLLQATNDPPTFAPTLRYKKSTETDYRVVSVGSTAKETPVVETGDCTVSGSDTPADPWTTVAYPNAVAGDLLIFFIAWDDSTATTSVTAPAGPNGETLTSIQGPVTDSSTETRCQAWYTVATGTWTAGNLSFNPSATESWSATCIKVLKGEFDAATPIGASGTSAATVTNDTTVDSPAFSAGASDGGGVVIWGCSVDADPLSATPPTGWAILQRQDLGAVAHGVAVRTAAVTDSESIASATWSITSDSWASLAFVVRAPAPRIYVATSGNITAGGEATTQQLTGGTDAFVTGRMWDNENGSDSIDLTDDDYTEVEWCLQAQSPAVDTDVYTLRVYKGSAVLDTYTVTPQWTIGTPGGGTPFVRIAGARASLAGTGGLAG